MNFKKDGILIELVITNTPKNAVDINRVNIQNFAQFETELNKTNKNYQVNIVEKANQETKASFVNKAKGGNLAIVMVSAIIPVIAIVVTIFTVRTKRQRAKAFGNSSNKG